MFRNVPACSGMFRVRVLSTPIVRQLKLAFDHVDMDFPKWTSLIFLGLTHFLGRYISNKIIVSSLPNLSFIKLLVKTKLKLSY